MVGNSTCKFEARETLSGNIILIIDAAGIAKVI